MDHIPENITNELIVAFLNGETTNEQMRQIQTWMDSSEENKKYVEDLRLIWAETKMLNPVPVDVNIDKAWGKLSARIDNNIKEKDVEISAKANSSFTYRTLLKIAAVLIPALIVASLVFIQNKEVRQIVLTTTTESIEKELTDGSKIKLNVNSELTYPEQFEEKTREVKLVGEAFFEISPNKVKPFIIHSNKANICVVGTSFNVKSNTEFVEVYVKTGKVQLYGIDVLSNDTNMVTLIPGEKGFYDFRTNKAYKQDSPNENDLFWISKTLIFHKTELAEVIGTLKEKYNVNIMLKDNKLKELKLSATFENQSIDSVLEIIAASLNIKVSKTNSSYEIDGQGN